MAKKILKTNLVVALLFVIALLCCGPIVHAGNLEPSAGPGSTMKTLDEVEPRVPISQSDIPFTIVTAGSYYLTEDVTSVGSGITVGVDDVTLDLGGFALVGPGAGSNYGIYMFNRSNVEIRNGTIRDFGYGIYESSSNAQDHRVIDVRVLSNRYRGIYLYGKNHLIKDCTSSDNGASSASVVYGIYVGTGSRVTGNMVHDNGTLVTNNVYGIYAGSGSTVIGNTSHDNGSGAAGPYIYGIYVGWGGTISNNVSYLNGYGARGLYIYGIFASHASTVTGNTSYSNGNFSTALNNVYGIYASSGCVVSNNASYDNGTSSDGPSVRGFFTMAGCTVRNNTAFNNGTEATGVSVRGFSIANGCSVTGNSSYSNGTGASGSVYGIYLGGNCTVDQNTSYSNNGTNMNNSGTCSYGTNVPQI